MSLNIKGANTKQQDESKWWKDLISGMAGGLVSVTICAPLDIARTRMNMMVWNSLLI